MKKEKPVENPAEPPSLEELMDRYVSAVFNNEPNSAVDYFEQIQIRLGIKKVPDYQRPVCSKVSDVQ